MKIKRIPVISDPYFTPPYSTWFRTNYERIAVVDDDDCFVRYVDSEEEGKGFIKGYEFMRSKIESAMRKNDVKIK